MTNLPFTPANKHWCSRRFQIMGEGAGRVVHAAGKRVAAKKRIIPPAKDSVVK